MEALAGLVGRECAIATLRMPVGIYHRAADVIVFGIQPRAFAVLVYHGGAMLAAHMEHILIGIRAVWRVAVVALTVGHGVLDDGEFVEVAEVALIYAHLAVNLVTGCDAAVSQAPLVQRIRADVDGEVIVLHPVSVYLGANGHGQVLATVRFGKFVPFSGIEVGVLAVGMQLPAVGAFDRHVHALHVSFFRHDREIEGRDSGGNGHADVVGEDGRRSGHLADIIRSASASPQ